MAVGTDNDQESRIDAGYNRGSGSYNPQSLRDAEAYTQSGIDQAEAFANDPNNASRAVEDSEANPPNPMNFTGGGKQIDKSKLQKAVTFAKKRGGVLGLIAVFGVGGGLLAGFFGPASMLINLVENFSISNDSSSTVLERRFAKVFGHMAASDSQTLCANSSKITCRMGRLSNKSLKQLSKKGVTAIGSDGKPIDFSKGGYPKENPARYSFDVGDGKPKVVNAADLRGFLANKDNAKYAAKLLGTRGAFNLRVNAWAGKYIQKNFFDRFSISRKGGLANGEEGKFKNSEEKLKATREKLLKDIPGVDTLKGIDAKIKEKVGTKFEKSKGGGVAYTIASTSCMASKAPAIISAGVAGVQLARLLPIISDVVLGPGTKMKNSGVDTKNAITPGEVDAVNSLLTNRTKNSEGKMTSALDSPYLLAALGVNKGKPPVSAKFTPGYGVLTDPGMKASREVGKAVEPACNAILTPMAMFTFTVIESAITKTNPIGAIIGVAGGLIVGVAAEPVVQHIVGAAAQQVIAAIADNDNLKDLQGQELGDALGVSAAAFFSAGSMARNIPTLTQDQVVAFDSMRSDNEARQRDMDIASLSPFDTSSPYTMLGSLVHSAQMAVLTSNSYNGSLASVLGGLASLPQSVLSSNVSAATNFTKNYCGYANEFDLSTSTDTPAVNMAGLPCTGITPEQDSMSTDEALNIMIQKGWVDGEKSIPDGATIDDLVAQDIIKKDTPLSTYIESCGNASSGDYLFNASGCVVKSSVTGGIPTASNDWGADICVDDKGKNACATGSSGAQTDDTRAFAAMSVFLIDFQLAQSVNGEDEEVSSGSADTSSTSLENSGKINAEGWAYPLDSPKTLVTYPGHNGDDMGTPIGSKVYSMREGKVVATDTQSVAEIESIGFCNLGFTKINGPQKNLTIESTVNGVKYTIRYAHLSEFKVKVGDVVKAGDLVALSGNTGCVTKEGDGAHLHVDINGGAIYPRQLLGTSF